MTNISGYLRTIKAGQLGVAPSNAAPMPIYKYPSPISGGSGSMEPFRPAPNTESHLPVSETSDALRKQIGELALLLDEAHAQLSIRALKIANLERALFTAVEPLEALNMVGNADGRLSIEVWQAIIKGIEAVRSALARTERRS